MIPPSGWFIFFLLVLLITVPIATAALSSGAVDDHKTPAKTKKINSQNVVIKKINSTADVSKCHVLYVSGSPAGEVDPFITKAKDFNCLIITEGKGLAENTSAINFVIVGSAIQFEMNKSLFESKQLIVGNSLEKLATKVIN